MSVSSGRPTSHAAMTFYTNVRGRRRRICLIPSLGVPTVLVSDFDHRGEDVVPGFGFHHDVVGEHAAVPADVLDGFRRLALVVLEPVAGDLGDVEFAGGVVGEAMAAGLVVGAAAVHR